MPRRRGARSRQRPASAGLGTLIVGVILAAAGAYLFTNQVDVGAGPFGGVAWFGQNSFGLLLVPLLLGIGLLFVNEGSRVGRALVGIGAVVLLAAVLNTFRISFRTTSLFNTLMMLGLTVSGVGLMARSLLSGRGSGMEIDEVEEPYEDAEKARLRVELVAAQERLRALEAPKQDDEVRQTVDRSTSVDNDLADLIHRKRPPTSQD